MNCNCGHTGAINSWYDLQNTQPRSPLDLIANADMNGSVTGVFTYSDTFIDPPGGTWAATPVSLDAAPTCSALRTDDLQKVADAAQWNFRHLTGNLSTDLAPPLKKVIYLRGGTEWVMGIEFNLSEGIDELELSFRDNAGTRGDYVGAIPVIKFTGPFSSGVNSLVITLKDYGHVTMGLKTVTTAMSDWGMYESEWIIVP